MMKCFNDGQCQDAIQIAEKTGKEQYDVFVAERLTERKPISDTIKKRLPLFSRLPEKEQAKSKE